MALKTPRITLEQWLTFKTVVDEGSFARAAEALNKSQSAVSYALGQLNAQLPEPALVLKGRKAELSEAGEVLYRRAAQLLKEALEAEAIADCQASGIQAEVTVAVDALLQVQPLLCAFEEFSARFPLTRLRILETSLSGTTEALLEKQADIVITPQTPVGFAGPIVGHIEMRPVATPGHALVSSGRDIPESELRGFRQIVLRDTGARREQDSGWLQSDKRWTVSHFSTSVQMVRAGLGFAFLPLNWIREELDSGALAIIPMHDPILRSLPLYVLMADRDSADPASRGLFELLRQTLRQDPDFREGAGQEG